MIQHTPGPWAVSCESVDDEWAVVTTPGGAVIANVNADHRQDANARLIAAAPDLLAALKDARDTIHMLVNSRGFEGEGTAEEWTVDFDAAIARAEGR